MSDAAARHAAPVFICLPYGEDLPAALSDYRLIAPALTVPDFNAALRAQQIFARERLERDAVHASQEKKRSRARSSKAFAGGAVMGFASSVALAGALGAGAISAAGQLKLEADPLAPPPGVPLLRPLSAHEEQPAWSVAQLENVSYSQQVAEVEQALAAAEQQMAMAPEAQVVLDVPAMPADDDGMWRPSTTPAPMMAAAAPARLAPAAVMQVASIDDAKADAAQLLEIPDLAPDFWRIVNGSESIELAKVPDPTLISDYGSDDGLWRPS